MPIVQRLARSVRNSSSAKIILGGYHATALPEDTFRQVPEADFIISGEGEAPLRELLDGKASVPGISWRNSSGIHISREKMQLDELSIPNPAYSLLPRRPDEYNYNVQTTRGCAYRCGFCVNGFFWGNPRSSPLDRVEQELLYLNSVLPQGSLIHFSDNIVTYPREHVLSLCDIIQKNELHLQFSGDTRAGHIDDEVAQRLADANFRRLCIGFEDSDPLVLGKAQKMITLEENIRTAKIIRNNSDMIIEAYWIVGLPGMDYKTAASNLATIERLLEECIVDTIATSTVFTPLPGSPMYDFPNDFDLKIDSDEWERYLRHNYRPTYSLSNLDENQLMFFFLLFESTILRSYLHKLHLSAEDIASAHTKLLDEHQS